MERISALNNPVARLGDMRLYVLSDLGCMMLFMLKAVKGLFRQPFRLAKFVKQIHSTGVASSHVLHAEFDNFSGKKKGASVQVVEGVVSEVSETSLNEDSIGTLSSRLKKDFPVFLDSVASAKSLGKIRVKYIQVHLGERLNFLKSEK